MKTDFFKKELEKTFKQLEETLLVKGLEYVRNDNPMHNFEVGAKIKNVNREQVIFDFALKHYISIQDILKDLDENKLPKKETVEEKWNDYIIYMILQKISVLDKLEGI